MPSRKLTESRIDYFLATVKSHAACCSSEVLIIRDMVWKRTDHTLNAVHWRQPDIDVISAGKERWRGKA